MHAAPCAASSRVIALPTGWVAPVTMQTKPYYKDSQWLNLMNLGLVPVAHKLAV